MRNIVLYTIMSLDGAVDHPGQYTAADSTAGKAPDFDSEMVDLETRMIAKQDTVLLGRNMYDEWSRYWPSSNEQPFADFINNVKKYVVTSTPLANDWTNVEPIAGPVEEAVRTLKAQPGGDIGVHGSIELAQSMLAASLIDELQLLIGPKFGFDGRQLFDRVQDVRRLKLLNVTPTSSGGVWLAYRAA